MPIICLMVRENHKMVREKSGNFVRAHGWTPCIIRGRKIQPQTLCKISLFATHASVLTISILNITMVLWYVWEHHICIGTSLLCGVHMCIYIGTQTAVVHY